MDVVWEAIEFIKGKGKASQKTMVAPSGHAGHLGRKQEAELSVLRLFKPVDGERFGWFWWVGLG
jgi:hypothetical protein